MSMTCVTAGCTKPCHKSGNRLCSDHMIEFLSGSLDRANRSALQGRGLPLRDHFAGQALAGFCVEPSKEIDPEEYAKASYVLADAMLAAREGGDQ